MRNILYGFIFCVITIVGVLLFYGFYHTAYTSFKTNKINITMSEEYWSTKDVKITVKYDGDVAVNSYSFDGGKTWQKENVYIAKENKKLKIVLKGSWGRTSEEVNYLVSNVDKELPTIEASDIIYTAVGKDFNIDNHYSVIDRVSGVKTIEVDGEDSIDTSAIGEYEINISATDIAGNMNAKTIKVSVVDAKDPNLLENKKDPVPVTGVSVDKTKVNLIKGATVQVTPTVKPANATNKKIVWSSVNTSVAKVDSKGVITAVGAGTTTVIATTADNERKAEIRVVVSNQAIEVQSVTLDKKSDTVTTDANTIILTPTVKPENATNQTLTWSSTNPNVAAVKNGVVTVRGEGESTIVVSSVNGKIATYRIVVRDNYEFTATPVIRQKEIIGYRIIILKNGIDITKKIDTIVEPFKISPQHHGRIEVTPAQYELMSDSIVIFYNERRITVNKVKTQE